jgi:hypothetical protein
MMVRMKLEAGALETGVLLLMGGELPAILKMADFTRKPAANSRRTLITCERQTLIW